MKKCNKLVINGFVEDAPFIVRQTHTHKGMPIKEALATSMASYPESLSSDRAAMLKRYRVTDLARKVAGVGSVGTRCWVMQCMIQAAPDIFPGWGEVEKKHFYIRQLRDMKGGVEFEPEKVKIEHLPQYASLCAWALALATRLSACPQTAGR